MRCRDICGFVGPDDRHAQHDLSANQREPNEYKPGERVLRTEPAPGNPGTASNCCEDYYGEKAMNHLQADLKSGNGIDRSDFQTLLIILDDGCSVHGREDFSVSER